MVILQISFTGCKPLIKAVDTDFYTGEFVPERYRSVEHILPKSKGGKNNISNYAMTSSDINGKRGNMSLTDWILRYPIFLNNMKNYVNKYFNTEIKGVEHGKEVAKTIKDKYNIDLLA